MPDNTAFNNQASSPPHGDNGKANNYLQKLTGLLDRDKVTVNKTDLQKFDPSTIQDHYRIDLREYDVEVSHSKQPDSGRDFYIMLFNSLKKLENGCTDKVILAYIHLTSAQFAIFKTAAENQIERIKKAEEEKRFKEALNPIDEKLDSLTDHSPLKDEATAPADDNKDHYFAPQPFFDNNHGLN